jgi:hypothetical protein
VEELFKLILCMAEKVYVLGAAALAAATCSVTGLCPHVLGAVALAAVT